MLVTEIDGTKTHEHRKPVVWKDLGQIVEKVFIVFAQFECFQRDGCQTRLEIWRELGLVLP